MKKLRPLILFGIGGLIYVLIELIARGRSHWSMFIVGGLAFFLIGCINEKCRKMPLVRQMLIGALVITALEFTCGCIVNLSVSDGWSGCAKVAEFYDMLGQLRESVPVINNTCTVPAVVTGGILWGIRIVGAKGNYRITTNTVEVMQS